RFQFQSGGAVAVEEIIDVDFSAIGSSGDINCASYLSGCSGGRRGRCAVSLLEFRDVQLHFSVDVCCNFRTLGDSYIFAVHEEEERCCGEKYQACCDNSSGHCSGVPSTLDFLYGT